MLGCTSRSTRDSLTTDDLTVPPRGLEPRTNGLKVRCSTVELEGREPVQRENIFPRCGSEPGGRGYRLVCVASGRFAVGRVVDALATSGAIPHCQYEIEPVEPGRVRCEYAGTISRPTGILETRPAPIGRFVWMLVL